MIDYNNIEKKKTKEFHILFTQNDRGWNFNFIYFKHSLFSSILRIFAIKIIKKYKNIS
jgi:hypothetical protein